MALAAAVAGPLQERLESTVFDTLVPKVASLVKDAVLHGFRASFADNVVPATERALQAMFHQVGEKCVELCHSVHPDCIAIPSRTLFLQ